MKLLHKVMSIVVMTIGFSVHAAYLGMPIELDTTTGKVLTLNVPEPKVVQEALLPVVISAEKPADIAGKNVVAAVDAIVNESAFINALKSDKTEAVKNAKAVASAEFQALKKAGIDKTANLDVLKRFTNNALKKLLVSVSGLLVLKQTTPAVVSKDDAVALYKLAEAVEHAAKTFKESVVQQHKEAATAIFVEKTNKAKKIISNEGKLPADKAAELKAAIDEADRAGVLPADIKQKVDILAVVKEPVQAAEIAATKELLDIVPAVAVKADFDLQ